MTSLTRSFKFRRWIAIITSIVVLAAFAQAGFANGMNAQEEDAGPQVLTGVNGGAVRQVRAVGEATAQTRASTAWALVPGMSINIAAPGPTFLLARFGDETNCYGSNAGWCSVRILVNGVEMDPAAGLNYAMDSPNAGGDGNTAWEGHFLERFSKCLPAGNYNITVQWASRQIGAAAIPTFQLDDYTLVVEQIAGCQPAGD
jgi:hypothetical protein